MSFPLVLLALSILVPLHSVAQVKVCVDAKGKKTFTDYECEKVGLKSSAVIQDINITPKQCPALQDAITNHRNTLVAHNATPASAFDPMRHTLRNMYSQQLDAAQLRYQRECVR